MSRYVKRNFDWCPFCQVEVFKQKLLFDGDCNLYLCKKCDRLFKMDGKTLMPFHGKVKKDDAQETVDCIKGTIQEIDIRLTKNQFPKGKKPNKGPLHSREGFFFMKEMLLDIIKEIECTSTPPEK